jgi:glutamate-ammonia-ligase adenylyltransferase
VTIVERLLEDPPRETALVALARAGFREPGRAARELRLAAGDPRARSFLPALLGRLPGTLSRLPDADAAVVHLERFVRAGGAPVLALLATRGRDSSDALLWALGGSPFLGDQVVRHPDWAEWLTRPHILARARRAGEIAAETRRALAGQGREAARDVLRLVRRREVLHVAVRDLLRLSSVRETLSALTTVADALVRVALEAAVEEVSDPRLARVPRGSGLAVLGLGKLGGGELNFSSDIDLVYVDGPDGLADAHGHAHALARCLTNLLGETTHEGHVYRVDLRLRPEGRAGALVHSLDAVEQYYLGRAATWERLALLKARMVAGDAAVGREFARRTAPFVWRRPFGPEDVLQVLRLKQEGDRRLASRGLERRHVKLGRGGIREIELVVQVLQIRQRGALRLARSRGTLFALEALRSAGALAAPEHDALRRAYLFLRDVENKLQMAHDTQTHVLPDDDEGLALLAARLGRRTTPRRAERLAARLRREIDEQMSVVHGLYGELLGRLVRSGSAP